MMRHALVLRLALVVFLGVIGWVGYQSYREMQRNKAIQSEIASLEVEKSKIQQENALLKERIEYLKTDEFKEQEAKDKLNYREEGEKVVIVKPSVAGASTVQNGGDAGFDQGKASIYFQVPNYQKWWEQFFGKHDAR